MSIYECTRCGARIPGGQTMECKDGPCPMALVTPPRCWGCFTKLSREEQEYYGATCEDCEYWFSFGMGRSLKWKLRRAWNYLMSLLD